MMRISLRYKKRVHHSQTILMNDMGRYIDVQFRTLSFIFDHGDLLCFLFAGHHIQSKQERRYGLADAPFQGNDMVFYRISDKRQHLGAGAGRYDTFQQNAQQDHKRAGVCGCVDAYAGVVHFRHLPYWSEQYEEYPAADRTALYRNSGGYTACDLLDIYRVSVLH